MSCVCGKTKGVQQFVGVKTGTKVHACSGACAQMVAQSIGAGPYDSEADGWERARARVIATHKADLQRIRAIELVSSSMEDMYDAVAKGIREKGLDQREVDDIKRKVASLCKGGDVLEQLWALVTHLPENDAVSRLRISMQLSQRATDDLKGIIYHLGNLHHTLWERKPSLSALTAVEEAACKFDLNSSIVPTPIAGKPFNLSFLVQDSATKAASTSAPTVAGYPFSGNAPAPSFSASHPGINYTTRADFDKIVRDHAAGRVSFPKPPAKK